MKLSFEDRLKRLVPSSIYYRHKIAQQIRHMEPELAILHDLVRPGCRAVDVGCNRGIYSYALARLAAHVEAFEPNPELVKFARAKLPRNVAVHQVGLSDREGEAFLKFKFSPKGRLRHLTAELGTTREDSRFAIPVPIRTLDSYGFDDVGFIKIDTEGSELAIVEGAQQTVRRHRPVLLIEIGYKRHPDRPAVIERLADRMNCDALVVVGTERVPAAQMPDRASRKSLGLNVLFIPK